MCIRDSEESDQEEEEEEQVKGAESDPEQSESQSLCGEADSPLSAPSSCSSVEKEDSKPSAKTPKTPKQAPCHHPQRKHLMSSPRRMLTSYCWRQHLLWQKRSIHQQIPGRKQRRKAVTMKTVSTVKAWHQGCGSYPVKKKACARFQIELVTYQAQLPAGGEFQSIPPNTSCQTPEFHGSPHMNLLNDPNYNNCLHYWNDLWKNRNVCC